MYETDVLEIVFPKRQLDPYVAHMFKHASRASDIELLASVYKNEILEGHTQLEAFRRVLSSDWGNSVMFSAEVYVEPVLIE